MKRSILLLVLLVSVLSLTGTGCKMGDVVSVTIRDAYDLRIQVWDNRVGGAFEGAFVTVLETGDGSHSGADGWTDYLKTPANAQWIQVVVEWYDRGGFAHSYQTGISLQHQTVTTARVHVDTTPPR